MKVTFWDSEVGTEINLQPETMEEVAALARMAINSKSEKPDIYVNIEDKPYCSIWMKKVDKRNQRFSIRNTKK
jgi:hypothetical protein